MGKNMKDQNKEHSPKHPESTFLGMPMQWQAKKIFKTIWNKEDNRLFPPKAFGIGWTLNFYVVGKKIGLIKGNKND